MDHSRTMWITNQIQIRTRDWLIRELHNHERILWRTLWRYVNPFLFRWSRATKASRPRRRSFGSESRISVAHRLTTAFAGDERNFPTRGPIVHPVDGDDTGCDWRRRPQVVHMTIRQGTSRELVFGSAAFRRHRIVVGHCWETRRSFFVNDYMLFDRRLAFMCLPELNLKIKYGFASMHVSQIC